MVIQAVPTRPRTVKTVAAAACAAVAFWALKPIFISIIGTRGGFAEVYVAAASISVAASGIAAVAMWKRTKALLRDGRVSRSGAGSAALSGLFLAMWY